MLTEKQKEEIKGHLENSQNPLFFFDNDPDGLCSFLILQRYIGRGKGINVKSFPDLNVSYFRKVVELQADYIFILDKPVVSKEFWEEVRKVNIPVVWIDHHGVDKNEVPDFINYYNPFFNENSTSEPVTALCYDITKRKEDLWLAVIGCVADSYLPNFYEEFQKDYPDLSIKTNKPFDVLFNSGIGKIGRVISNGLKDKTSNVVYMLKFLMKVTTPYEILEENSKNHLMHSRSKQIEKKYELLLEKAKKIALTNLKEKILFFKYSGELSISGELANELIYTFPGKIICVAYVNGSKINLSLRGHNIKEKFLEIIEKIEGARGGGHKDAVGGQIPLNDWDKFKELLEKSV